MPNQQTAYEELLLQYENAHHLIKTQCFLANQCFSPSRSNQCLQKKHAQMEGIPTGTPHILHASQRSSTIDLIICKNIGTFIFVFQNMRSLFSDNKFLKPENSFQVSFFRV